MDVRGFDVLPAQAWIATPDGALSYVNPAALNFFCCSMEKLLGEGWQGVCHPSDLPGVMQAWRMSLESGNRYETQFRLRRGTDHLYLWHVVRAAPVRDDAGAITSWIGINTEIDALKRAEEVAAAQASRARRDAQALREAQGAAEALAAERTIVLNQLAEGVITTDASGAITFVNLYAERMHGCSIMGVPPEEYAGAYRLFTLDDETYPSDQLPLARAVRGETVRDASWKIRRADGQEVIAIGTAVPIFDAEGHQMGAVITMRNISG